MPGGRQPDARHHARARCRRTTHPAQTPPRLAGPATDTPGLRLAATTFGLAALTLGLVAVGVYAAYGSVTVALADARGDPVAVDPSPLKVPLADPGSYVTQTIRLINLTGDPVDVTAAQADCDCAEFTGLPLTLAPGGRGEVQLILHVPSKAVSSYRRRVAFETSVGMVPLAVRGTVRAAPTVERK